MDLKQLNADINQVFYGWKFHKTESFTVYDGECTFSSDHKKILLPPGKTLKDYKGLVNVKPPNYVDDLNLAEELADLLVSKGCRVEMFISNERKACVVVKANDEDLISFSENDESMAACICKAALDIYSKTKGKL